MTQKVFEFVCADCGELHRGAPSFGYEKPNYYFSVPEADRAERIEIDHDCCAVDSQHFFIRGLLEIPIGDVDDPFLWGLWVSQSEESFRRYRETYDKDQSGDGSFGWLAVDMPYYKRTAPGEDLENLACAVRWRADSQRPLIAPHECDHPLYSDFKEGISWELAIEIARQIMHPA